MHSQAETFLFIYRILHRIDRSHVGERSKPMLPMEMAESRLADATERQVRVDIMHHNVVDCDATGWSVRKDMLLEFLVLAENI